MRKKIHSLDELKAKGLCIMDGDETVEISILDLLKEKGLLISDLSKVTGISRQNINAVVKNKMKPGVDFALKVAYVLGVKVEDLFKLTDQAWVKPYKEERDATLYLDTFAMEIVDSIEKKEDIKKTGYEYWDRSIYSLITKEEYTIRLRDYLDQHTPEKMNDLKTKNRGLSTTKLNSLAIEALKEEFHQQYQKRYKKLGERIEPYVIR